MKMWILIFALLTVHVVTSGATDICEKGGLSTCASKITTNEEDPFGVFPDSIEALDELCPYVTNFLKCLLDYKNQCNRPGLFRRPGSVMYNVEQKYELASVACDKDSELHRELSIRLPCLARVVGSQHNACTQIAEDAVEAVRSRIFGMDVEEWKKRLCLKQAVKTACFAANVAVTCGEEARELVGILMDRTGFLDNACHADIREEVKEMISVMEVEMGEQLAPEKLISKA